jgi:hypothetical protein
VSEEAASVSEAPAELDDETSALLHRLV